MEGRVAVAPQACMSVAVCQTRQGRGPNFHSRGPQSACCTESAAILEELRLECWTELMDMNALALGLIFRHPDNAQVPCFLY